MKMNKINIEIRDTFGFIQMDGKVKTVKLETILKSFSGIKTAIESPILPNNCIKYKEKGNKIIVVLYHEPTHFTATVGTEKFENCARPGLILKYGLNRLNENSYTLSESACFGVKDPYIALNNKTRLYGLPFPNIGSSGWICWGSNSSGGTFNSLIGLKSYIDRLFGSPFNTHLFNSELLKTTANISTPKELFQYLQDRPTFDYTLFENIGNDYTIESL